MEKKFTAIVTRRAARPRSKRLRETSSGGSSGAVVVSGGTSDVQGVAGDGHTHGNLSALNEISTDTDGYQYLTQLRETENPETGGTTVEQVTEKVKAGYADVAKDLAEDSPVREQFLSRLVDDVAKGKITFEQAIKVLGLASFGGGAEFGEFIQSLAAGKGARIDANGNAEFESVRVRSYFECLELIINRLSAIEGDQILTEADTIETVEDKGGGVYGLHLRRKWDGYFTAQHEGSVLKGIINTLAAGSGQYYTSWMRVNSVDTANNYIEVTAYPDADTPAGRNYPPCADMKIARWGSQTDATRQSCLYLSSTEGRIVRLRGVTKPIIGTENYGATFGTLPEFLSGMDLPIIDGQDYVYARGLIVQDIIRMDYLGKPVSEVVDRGQWESGASYYCEARNPRTGVYETSDVWHVGCRWRCAKTGTSAAPVWNSTDWAVVEGDPRFTVEFADTERIFAPDKFGTTLAIVARKYNTDVTDIISDADVAWSRYSEDADGVHRAVLDSRWATKRAGAGKTIRLTVEDCDMDGDAPSVLRFCATVTLRDSKGDAAGTAQATFHVKFVRDGADGADGAGGVSISLMPGSFTARVGVRSRLVAQVALYDGGMPVPYANAEHGNFICSTLPDGYEWRHVIEDNKFYYWIFISPTDTNVISIPFTVTYRGMTYPNAITIQPVADGKKGDRGPALRGPQAWSDCAEGYAFQAGGEGEEWKDVVMYRDNYYSCTKSHAKTADNYPGSSTAESEGAWQLADKVEIIATKILLSTYALVKNLGVEAIEMKDAGGNVLFQAKDGAVSCKTGVFDNVTIQSGRIAGFKIDGNLLTNEDYGNDASIIMYNETTGATAAIGGNVTAPSLGGRGLTARFESHSPTLGGPADVNVSMLAAATGMRDNIALWLDGGAVSGFAMRTSVIAAAMRTFTLNRADYNVIALNTVECVLTLPVMQLYDDGHVIRIKKCASGTLKIKMSSCHTYDSSGGDLLSMPVLMCDQTSTLTGTNTLTVANIGEAMELVWVRDIKNVVNGTTYYGAWVQYKMPRNW